MEIVYTIYPDNLTNETISDDILLGAANTLAQLIKDFIRGEYPNARVSVPVCIGVCGTGSGIKVYDDDDDDDDIAASEIAERLGMLIERRTSSLEWNRLIWA